LLRDPNRDGVQCNSVDRAVKKDELSAVVREHAEGGTGR